MSAAAAAQSPPLERTWRSLWAPVLTGLAVFRVLVPLVVLAAAPGRIPLLPRYDGIHLDGDAVGYLEAIRSVFAAFARTMVGPGGLLFTVVLAGGVLVAGFLWRRGRRGLALLLPAAVISVGVAVVLHDAAAPGAPVVGWSLVWALALTPLPIFGAELTDANAFPVGVALGLAANGVTTVATAYLGLRASGRHSVGLVAAGLFATWPVWVGLVAGRGAWENGQWDTDAGLHLYTEPVSTMLVVLALVTLLSPAPGEGRLVASGLALGFATAVKLTNGLIALFLVPLVAIRHGVRRAAWLAAGGLVGLPIVVAWWPKGYVDIYDGKIAPVPAYSLDYVHVNWLQSSIFTPRMLLVLLLPALAGIIEIAGWYARSLLVMPVVVTAAAYSAYYVTYQHPRFLFVALPPLFVLDAAGLTLVVRGIAARVARDDAGG